MYAKMLNMDKFVEINKLTEITNPIYLEHGTPTTDGLFSYEIFGVSTKDRRNKWAYVDLNDKFLHPLVHTNLVRYSKKFEGIISGTEKYVLDKDGNLIKDELNGNTGLRWLYDIYPKLKWRESESIFSNERIKFLQQDRDDLFITKFPVTPPFYRDINEAEGGLGVHQVNDLYKRLISQARMLKKREGSFVVFGDMTRANVQNALSDIFNYYIFDEFHGKKGVMRQFVMGVNVDRGARLVMSAPKIKGERHTDMQVQFDRTGIPLATCCAIGYDFVLKGVKDFFENEFVRGGKYPYKNDKGEVEYLDLIDPMVQYSEEYIKKKIKAFIKGPSTRFDTIKIPKNKQNRDAKMHVSGRFDKNNPDSISNRPATWTDILFIVCSKVLVNKHIMVTRYPIEDFYCIFHTKIAILTTIQTTTATISGETYSHYPVVIPDSDASNSFVDTLIPSNVLLKGIGGDYDGDQVTVRMNYTDEANLDSENFIKDKKNYVNLMGGNIRLTERDFVQGLYSLTKDDPNDGVILKSLNHLHQK